MDHRRYIRLKSIFPVEFRPAAGDSLPASAAPWLQGYTRDISLNGICLETAFIPVAMAALLDGEIELRLRIPLSQPPISAKGKIIWSRRGPASEDRIYRLGVEFSAIGSADRNRLVRQARWMILAGRLAGLIFLMLLLNFAIVWHNRELLRDVNKNIICELQAVERREKRQAAVVADLFREKTRLFSRLQAQEEQLVLQRYKAAGHTLVKQSHLASLTISPSAFPALTTGQAAADLPVSKPFKINTLGLYQNLVEQYERARDALLILTRQKQGIRRSVVDQMRIWLKKHQSPVTGLVMSFEGQDSQIKDWAFIYDQALAVNVFLAASDREAAAAILNFFKKNLSEKFSGFPNGYYYDSGQVSEYTTHCGPNVWLGIAAAQYTAATGDKSYLDLARRIADWLIGIQDKDPNGGLKGGPEFSWFSTEHNLDAYAFFGMLGRLTDEEKYKTAQRKSLSWLKNFAMVSQSSAYPAPPVRRGLGDATVATDTFAWSVAALGPDKLVEIGMDPEAIMRFADENCRVKTEFVRPSGKRVWVEGYDFSRTANLPRGGLVSPEWTAQMIVSFRVLSRFCQSRGDSVKAAYYAEKAGYYVDELNQLIIASPSPRGQGEGCLPYSTMENADTGHGWNTPHGATTCSVAGTAYMIFAVEDINPLSLK
ncbi:MAG: PilZ domain-containing protein [Candidatus Omnitrophica bacterium]|nr:PilZ domain-containing protein [Candidatus Omnitrophota bacterium]